MERVQFQQEQMLAELKDLVQKKLFTMQETKQMMKKRTEFERALVRRVAKKADFLRYVEYEIAVEMLRRKRAKRLDLPTAPATVSDYSIVKRQFQIFERALKRFKDDVALWIQYIQLAKKEGARSLVGRITARAIQLHPNTPTLYVLAASHELDHGAPSAARTLLQRGIRFNGDSTDMWKEYVRMEIGFVESLQRRWDVLGISEGKGKDRAVDPAEDEPDVQARHEILAGALVKSVMTSAVQAVPTVDMLKSLDCVISHHPSSLAHVLQAHLVTLIEGTLADDLRGLELLLKLLVRHDMDAEELIEGIKTANETVLRHAKAAREASPEKLEQILKIYGAFVITWTSGSSVDKNMHDYLITSLERIERWSV